MVMTRVFFLGIIYGLLGIIFKKTGQTISSGSRKMEPRVINSQDDGMDSKKSEQSGTTHFGYQNVPESEKSKRVGAVFSSVASQYDLMNDFMSA